MGTEHRVVWKREGCTRKSKRYVSRAKAEWLLSFLTSKEPWTLFRNCAGPDTYVCCDGHECGCCGTTWRQKLTASAEGVPPLEYAHIEQRTVGKWLSPEVVAPEPEPEPVAPPPQPCCIHEWVTTSNKFFPTGYLCAKCAAPRPPPSHCGGFAAKEDQ